MRTNVCSLGFPSGQDENRRFDGGCSWQTLTAAWNQILALSVRSDQHFCPSPALDTLASAVSAINDHWRAFA